MEVKNYFDFYRFKQDWLELDVNASGSVDLFCDGDDPVTLPPDAFKQIVEQWCEYMGYELNKKDAPD